LVFGQLAVHVASSQVLPDKILLSRLLVEFNFSSVLEVLVQSGKLQLTLLTGIPELDWLRAAHGEGGAQGRFGRPRCAGGTPASSWSSGPLYCEFVSTDVDAQPAENTPLQQLASKRSRATFWTSTNAQQVLFATGSVGKLSFFCGIWFVAHETPAAILFVLWQGIGSRGTGAPLLKSAT
jgi:hypothetical protein